MSTAGHTTQFYLKNASGAVAGSDEVNDVTKVTFSVNGEQIDITKFKDTDSFRRFLTTLKTWDMKVEGFVDPTDAPQNLIRTKWLSGTPANLYMTYLRTPAASTGSKGFVGEVNVEGYEESPEVGNVVPFSASLKGTGAAAVDA